MFGGVEEKMKELQKEKINRVTKEQMIAFVLRSLPLFFLWCFVAIWEFQKCLRGVLGMIFELGGEN